MVRVSKEKMGNRSVRKNYIYNVSYQLLSILAPLITTPYISRVLGAEDIGLYSYVSSVTSYFVLFAVWGSASYGQREISYVRDDRKQRSVVFWETKFLQVCTSGIAALAYLWFASVQKRPQFYLIFLLQILAVALDITWFFQGMEEFGKIVLKNSAAKLLNIAYIFLFVKSRDDLNLYALGMTVFPLLGNASLWTRLGSYVDFPGWKALRPFRNIRTVFSMFIPAVAIEVYTVMDKVMLGLLTGDSFENGYYEQAIKVSKAALSVVTALGAVMVPRIGYYFQHREAQTVRELMYRSYRFVWFIGTPLCLGLIGISAGMVPWFYGAGYDKVIPLLRILSFLILAIGINNVTGVQYMVPTGRQNLFTFTVVLGAAVNFTMNMVLIPRMKSIGAALASVSAETVIALVQIYLMRHELSAGRIFRSGLPYWCAGAVMLAVLIIEGRRLVPTVSHSLWMIVSGGVVYLALLWIARDEFLLANGRLLLAWVKNNFVRIKR